MRAKSNRHARYELIKMLEWQFDARNPQYWDTLESLSAVNGRYSSTRPKTIQEKELVSQKRVIRSAKILRNELRGKLRKLVKYLPTNHEDYSDLDEAAQEMWGEIK